MSRLAQDVAAGLKAIEAERATKTSKTMVYLAETSSDLKAERQRALGRTHRAGLLGAARDAAPRSRDRHPPHGGGRLAPATLAIHLTGPRYGKRPEGTDESIVALQYELAQASGLQRVVWVGKTRRRGADQVAFLEALRADLDQRVDLLEHKTIEDLKEVILARLAPRPRSHTRPSRRQPSPDLSCLRP